MDLLDFTGEDLYFDKPLPAEVSALLQQASKTYGSHAAEQHLLRAYFLEPENFSVLVALYRYFYYQHRYGDAFIVAERTLLVAARQLDINPDWRALTDADLGYGVQRSMALMRFHLHALKGAGYLKLRLGHYQEALDRLQKVVDLDAADRIGAAPLRDLAAQALDANPEQSMVG